MTDPLPEPGRSSARLDHITISATDLDLSAAFYDAALRAVGLVRVVEFRDEEEDDGPTDAIGYGPEVAADRRSPDASPPGPETNAAGAAADEAPFQPIPDSADAQANATIWLVTAENGSIGPTGGAHLALRAQSPDQVSEFFTAAVAGGGAIRQRPRRWEVFRAGYFGSSVADPDGNVLEVFAHE